MAWRIDHLVLAGELDNTQLGWTVGWLELSGISERLKLKLAGNCHPDLAGWRFLIKRIEPELENNFDGEEPPNYTSISIDQSGNTGDITADQLVKHFDIPMHELIQRLTDGEKPPFTWRKCLYLEWYGNTNGRVVVQSTRLVVERQGERAFEMTEEQWREQQRQSEQEISHFLAQIGNALEQPEKPKEADGHS